MRVLHVMLTIVTRHGVSRLPRLISSRVGASMIGIRSDRVMWCLDAKLSLMMMSMGSDGVHVSQFGSGPTRAAAADG